MYQTLFLGTAICGGGDAMSETERNWTNQKLISSSDWATKSLLAISEGFKEDERDGGNEVFNAELFGWTSEPKAKFRSKSEMAKSTPSKKIFTGSVFQTKPPDILFTFKHEKDTERYIDQYRAEWTYQQLAKYLRNENTQFTHSFARRQNSTSSSVDVKPILIKQDASPLDSPTPPLAVGDRKQHIILAQKTWTDMKEGAPIAVLSDSPSIIKVNEDTRDVVIKAVPFTDDSTRTNHARPHPTSQDKSVLNLIRFAGFCNSVDNNVNDSRLQPRQPRGSLQSRRGRLAQGEANKNKDNANVLPRDLSSVIINTVRDTGDRVSPAKRIQFANQMMQSNQNLMQPSSKPQLQSSVNFLPLFASSKPILTPSNPQQCYFEEWLLLSQTEQRSDHRVMEPTNCVRKDFNDDSRIKKSISSVLSSVVPSTTSSGNKSLAITGLERQEADGHQTTNKSFQSCSKNKKNSPLSPLIPSGKPESDKDGIRIMYDRDRSVCASGRNSHAGLKDMSVKKLSSYGGVRITDFNMFSSDPDETRRPLGVFVNSDPRKKCLKEDDSEIRGKPSDQDHLSSESDLSWRVPRDVKEGGNYNGSFEHSLQDNLEDRTKLKNSYQVVKSKKSNRELLDSFVQFTDWINYVQ